MVNLPKKKVFILIPAYNEEKVINDVINDIKILGYNNVVIIDDGSIDNTYNQAKKANVLVLRHIVNRGQGAALRTGINYALNLGAGIIVTYDADGQFNPKDIEKICQPIIGGECEVVLGSRFLSQNKVPFFKSFVLKSAILFTYFITNLNLTDVHNGFRSFSRHAAKRINIRQDKMAHASDIIHEIARLKLKYKEVPVTVRYTEYSCKKGQKISGAFRIFFDLVFK